MSQVTSGARRLLSVPGIYDFFQDLVGASALRIRWVRDFLQPFPGARLLDIGCGTAGILKHLPGDVDYTGFDMSPAYVESARARYGHRGRFTCEKVDAFGSGAATWNADGKGSGNAHEKGAGAAETEGAGAADQGYDIALAFGVLHHLGDEEARLLFQSARGVLKPGGRLVTIDPAFIPRQGPMARYVVSHDRGQNVRYPEAYAELGRQAFERIETTVLRGALRIPIDHAVLVCGA